MSRIKLNFCGSNNIFNEPLNKKVNGFIQSILGSDNAYHGTFSDYSISSVQGAVWNEDNSYSFPNGCSIYISSNDQDFINKVVVGVMSNKEASICGMKFIGFEVLDYNVYKSYDIVRAISPILVSTPDRRMLTFKDENFIEVLRTKTIKKLMLAGIDERAAKSIKFELFHPEKAKTTCTKIGESVNIGSKVMFIISGSRKARRTLYNMGIGKCTGFGFGAVSVNNKY